jgi:pyruvate kinase
MISNTSTVPQLAGGFISMDMVTKPPSTKERRTKIICTIGPASWSEENLGILMDAGMNVARFNFSHGDHEGHGAVLDRLRKVAGEKSRNIAGEYRQYNTVRTLECCRNGILLSFL